MRAIKMSTGALQQYMIARRFLSSSVWPRRLWCQASLIQGLSMLLIAGIAPAVINSVFAFELRNSVGLKLDTLWFWLLLHLCLVSIAAKVANMPVWWRWIHAVFPLAVAVMQQVALPATVYFSGFVITLALYWSVHNTRVPFYPSFPATWRAMQHILQQHAGDRPLRVLDIGSGIGDVCMLLSRQRPQDQVEGVEIAPLPWLVSLIRTTLSGSRARFTLGDYRQNSFAGLDVVFAYLSPAVMADVWQKVRGEMRPGSLFVSLEFPVPDREASHIIYPAAGAPPLFVYTL